MQLLYSNIDLNLFSNDVFDSTLIYSLPFKITISYLVGDKYSSSNYYGSSTTLFASKIAIGKISINFEGYNYFNKM